MSASLPQQRRPTRLPAGEYDELRRRVLERDGWRCQRCGRRDRLEVHHLEHRSRGGRDANDNLIVLCRECHELIHHTSTAREESLDMRTRMKIWRDGQRVGEVFLGTAELVSEDA